MKHHKVFLISALVLMLTIQACRPNTVAANPPAATDTPVITPTAATPPETSPETSQSNPAQAGTDVHGDDMKFVVTGTVRPADGIVSSGDMFNAQAGEYQQYVFVTLDVTCETTPDQQCHLSLFKMRLLGSDGILKYPESFISGVEISFKNTDFQGGTTISGDVPFIISVGASRLLLIYESLSGDSSYLALP